MISCTLRSIVSDNFTNITSRSISQASCAVSRITHIVVSHVLKIRHKLDSEQDWYTAMSAESRLISEKHNYNETWLNSEPVWCNWKIEINIRPGRGLIRSSSTLLETAARNVWFRGRPPIKSSAGVMQYLHNFGESMWWPPYRHRLGRPNSLITHTTEYS